MSFFIPSNKSAHGFTLIELIIVISMLAILCSIAIPAYSSWLPEYRLKSAVRELYSNMQLTKTMSIKFNDKFKMIFDTGGNGYRILRPDDTVERRVSFSNYDRTGEIRYGGGKATKNATTSGGALPGDGVSYQNNRISFTSRGLGSGMGYAYLRNNKGTAYAIGSWISGIIVLKKWNENKREWE